jgi:hypothetical protein
VQNLEQITAKQPSKITGQQNSASLTGTKNHFYLLIAVDDDDLVSNCWLVQDSKVHRRTLAECTV